jgi:DNA-binding NtrC family response regulator
MDASSLPDAPAQPTIWIVEDEPPAAELAAELCSASGAAPSVFRSALPFLRAFREAAPPRAIVLDWRLEHELSAALFMATRHRFPQLRVIYWTGSPSASLPAMVREDPWTQIVDKAGGAAAFEAAVRWALALGDDEIRGGDEQWA